MDYSEADYAYAEGAGVFDGESYAPEASGFNWGGVLGFLTGLAGTAATVATAFRGGAGQNPQAAQRAQAAQQQSASNRNLFLILGAALLGVVLVVLMMRRS
jgi:hypothetical protein